MWEDVGVWAGDARPNTHNFLLNCVTPNLTGFFYSKNRFDPLEILSARSRNDNKVRLYPFYPQEQLDTLLEITRLLVQKFGIKRILELQEINKFDLISGPAFPVNRFRKLVEGEGKGTELLEETSSAVDLFLQPGGVGLKMLDQPVSARTSLTVTDDEGEWVLVEVMGDLGDQRWTVGWMKADCVPICWSGGTVTWCSSCPSTRSLFTVGSPPGKKIET